MKKILHLLFIAVLLSGCEKEAPVSLRMMGSWSIKSIRPQNLSLDFVYGELTINQDYTASYSIPSETYNGTWFLDETSEEDYCYTDQDNNQVCNYKWVASLQVDVIHAATQKRKSVWFADLQFINDDHFIASVYKAGTTYEYHFERKR